MKKVIEVTFEVEVEIPDNTIDKILSDYKEIIDDTATNETLFQQIAYSHVSNFSFAEGIGKPNVDYKVRTTFSDTAIIAG